jgi:nicotinate dehydrogenase medium molybdopterin subunit
MKLKGIGVGAMLYGLGYGFSRPDFSTTDVEVAADGTITLWNGASELGQGLQTLLCQLATQELGIPYEDSFIVSADTGRTPDAGPVSASRSTYVQGISTIKACQELKSYMAEMAGEMLKVTPERLTFEDGLIFCSDEPAKCVTFRSLASEMHKHGKRIRATGYHNITTKDVDPETSQGDAYATYAWASQLAEVEVDTDTGQVNVLRLVSATDAGKAINPQMVEGQIEGGAIQGLGFALMEDMKVEQGVFKNAKLSTYLIPTAADVPMIEPLIVEVYDPTGPFGAKGIAEPATIPTAPTLFNAIADAIGLRVRRTPATPENILRLLGKIEEDEKEESLTFEDLPYPQP